MQNDKEGETLQTNAQDKSSKPINCKKNNQAEILCTNDDCSNFAFLCQRKQCECQLQHDTCMKLTMKSFITALQKKRYSFKQIQEKIKDEIQKAIDNLSELQTFLIAKCQQKYNNLAGLTSSEKYLIEAVGLGKVDQITGKNIWNIQLNLKKPQQAKNTIGKLQEDMNDLWSQFQKNLNELQTKMKNRFQIFGKDIIHFKDSKVIKSREEQRIIEGFFESQGQQIKGARMIYRGSERNFSASKFHYCCDEVQQTLTVCSTTYGKKIGGYMPLAWNSDGQHFTDSSLKSFLFSLTNNHKFVPAQGSKNHQFCHAKYGPVFGGRNDFVLVDACDQYANSSGDVNNAFKNPNYTQGNQQSYKLFSGAKQGCQFRVEQYEVWKLDFAD